MTIRKRLLAGLASAALLLAPALRAPAVWLPSAGLVLAGDAWAQYSRPGGSRSSGGYSRPAPRTPSFSTRPSLPRTPSTSGGYGRPSAPPSAVPFFGGAPSAGDQALSRQRAGEALRQQREAEQRRQEALRPAPQPAPARPGQPAPSYSYGGGSYGGGGSSWWGGSRTPSYGPSPSAGWFGRQGWAPPPYAAAAPRSFGIWDGLFLWFMLDNLTRPGYSDWFRGHRSDPGVQQWRQQADALAQDNADLRRKLTELDQRIAPGGPSDRAAPDTGWVEVPPDIPPEVASAEAGAGADKRRTPTAATTDEGGSGWGGMLFGFALVGGAGWLAWRAMRRRDEQGGSPMNKLQTAAAMARNVVSPTPYTARNFRVGMVLTVDLSPFILAAGATKVTPPEGSTAGRMTVAAVGRLDAGDFVRLHLDDRKALFQLHLDATGQPDECRYFSLIDEVSPADAGEWDVWLDPREGMIGWPEFQTKDGKLYQRVWSPGSGKVAPVVTTEQIATADGTESVRLQAMLYGAPTGLPAPAPPTEYILVSAVERQGQAWVEIRAGIDINPATLELT